MILNFATSLCYALVAVLYVSVLSNTDEFNLRMMDSTPQEDLGEPFVLRLTVLFLTTACCYGAQVLLERQQLAVEEAGEFAAHQCQPPGGSLDLGLRRGEGGVYVAMEEHIDEVRARGAKVIAITTAGDDTVAAHVENTIEVPPSEKLRLYL